MTEARPASDEWADGDTVTESAVSNEEIYELLSDRRRRYAVHYLKQVGSPVEVRELVEQVAAWENGKSIGELGAQERKRVYISFTQSHLSTLAEAGLIEWDEDADRVALGPATQNADIYLEIVSDSDIPWSYYYLGLSLAAGALLVVSYLGVGVLSDVSPYLVGGGIVAAFLISAAVHTLQRGRAKLGDEGPPPSVEDVTEP